MKIYAHSVLTLLFLISLSVVTSGQDPVFGQYYTAPGHLNPALSGVFDGQFRVGINYREQWQSIMPSNPFRTMAASFDYRIRAVRGDYASFGANVMRDQAGSSNFTTNRGHLTASYQKQLSGNRYSSSSQYLVAGAQAGLGQHSMDFNNLWFTNQWDSDREVVDNNRASGENFATNTTDSYLDFNAGLLWYAVFDQNFSIHAGGALHHISQPNISFLNNNKERLPRRWVGHLGGEIPFNKQLSILPAVMYTTQQTSRTTIVGANFRYTNRDWQEVALRAGLWSHISNKLDDEILQNALIFAAILETEKWNIGISYDVNTSSVSNLSNGRGGFELSLVYIHPTKYRERVKCPKY